MGAFLPPSSPDRHLPGGTQALTAHCFARCPRLTILALMAGIVLRMFKTQLNQQDYKSPSEDLVANSHPAPQSGENTHSVILELVPSD